MWATSNHPRLTAARSGHPGRHRATSLSCHGYAKTQAKSQSSISSCGARLWLTRRCLGQTPEPAATYYSTNEKPPFSGEFLDYSSAVDSRLAGPARHLRCSALRSVAGDLGDAVVDGLLELHTDVRLAVLVRSPLLLGADRDRSAAGPERDVGARRADGGS